MAGTREILKGNPDRFAVRIAFLPDPDEGCAATVEHSLSWGRLEIWVNGHNLCRHRAGGSTVDAVHWYQLPLLRWLTANWDFLLHEERLPNRNDGRDAWIAMQRLAESPLNLSDEEAERWDENWHRWWSRHGLAAAREGGLFPSLYIRRWRDQIEFSWGDRPVAGVPEGVRFDAYHGCARVSPKDVAEALFGLLDEASSFLLNERPESSAFQTLRRDVLGLRRTDLGRRLGLLLGLSSENGSPEQRWRGIESLFPRDLGEAAMEAILGASADDLVVWESSQAALMFGSVSPTVDEADARILAEKLVQHYAPDGECETLRRLVRNVDVEGSEEAAWRQGYELAEAFLDEIRQSIPMTPAVPVESVLERLLIKMDSISLRDASIRAVALAGVHHAPAILINQSYVHRTSRMRRFTLAHELCHILHDRSYGRRLALASGPWAPLDIEKRANAFAAMFLMPSDLVAQVVRDLREPLDTLNAVKEVADRFETSITATLEHLCNLGHLDEMTRDAIREELR